jgi:lysophospholipase L1-like esterase
MVPLNVSAIMKASGAVYSCAVLAALIIPVLVLPGDDNPDLPRTERIVKFLRKEKIPPDAADQVTAGYYEDLFDFSSRTISTNRLITGKWATNWVRYQPLDRSTLARRVDGFLLTDNTPNFDQQEFGGRAVTNSHGMADREYSVARPEGVRRLSLIGDSISRGLGANPGRTFEAHLEAWLNQREDGPYEILNFAVAGYRITQMLWVLEHRAAEFRPQVHIVGLTNLTTRRVWLDHIVQLVHEGRDLHYPYLRSLAQRAKLRPDDDPHTFDAKLAPYRDEVIAWALESMRTAASAQGAGLVVLLLPVVDDPDETARTFQDIKPLIERLKIPVVDVSDAFVGVRDLSPYRIATFNHHPTDAGHAVIAERLQAKLRENPAAWRIVTGH